MKCPNFGSQCAIDVCESCGTKNSTSKEDFKLALKRFCIKAIYTFNSILMPPAKFMAAIWSCSAILIIESEVHTIDQKISVILFGYLVLCGLADLFYMIFRKKYLNYKYKILCKTKKRYDKLLQKYGILPNTESYLNGQSDISTVPNYDTMEGHQFEYFCADLLEKNGFTNVIVTRGSGDHGIDILAEKNDISYAIQCKCYSSNIGNAAVQQALAGKKFYKKDIAVVLTNQYFTTQAQEEAAAFGVKLWDRNKLNELIENSK